MYMYSTYVPLNQPICNNRTILKKTKLFSQHVDPNRVTKCGWTAVEIAAINGHIDIVKMLVNQYNAKKNFENPNNGTTPLENAIEGGHLETVKYLQKCFILYKKNFMVLYFRQMIEDLGCEYGHMARMVKDLESAASLVITQVFHLCHI